MQPTITLTEMDFLRLNSLMENQSYLNAREFGIEELENELDRARVIDFPEIPTDLITMNSRFKYHNLTDDKVCEMTIVYPHQADLEKRWVSVTAPLGAALIGLRVGDEVDWEFPDGETRRLKILEVLYQPELNGDLHL